jgi:hypothetical protein
MIGAVVNRNSLWVLPPLRVPKRWPLRLWSPRLDRPMLIVVDAVRRCDKCEGVTGAKGTAGTTLISNDTNATAGGKVAGAGP